MPYLSTIVAGEIAILPLTQVIYQHYFSIKTNINFKTVSITAIKEQQLTAPVFLGLF
jgi:hypothetical protein